MTLTRSDINRFPAHSVERDLLFVQSKRKFVDRLIRGFGKYVLAPSDSMFAIRELSDTLSTHESTLRESLEYPCVNTHASSSLSGLKCLLASNRDFCDVYDVKLSPFKRKTSTEEEELYKKIALQRSTSRKYQSFDEIYNECLYSFRHSEFVIFSTLTLDHAGLRAFVKKPRNSHFSRSGKGVTSPRDVDTSVNRYFTDKVYRPLLHSIIDQCPKYGHLPRRQREKLMSGDDRVIFKEHYLSYKRVYQLGDINGRLHFHVIWHSKFLPVHTRDPNRTGYVNPEQWINFCGHLWKYGSVKEKALRFDGIQDAFSRAGWLWPCTRTPEGKIIINRCGNVEQVAHYISDYIARQVELLLKGTPKWKTDYNLRNSKSKNYGMRADIDNIKMAPTPFLISLLEIPPEYKLTTPVRQLRRRWCVIRERILIEITRRPSGLQDLRKSFKMPDLPPPKPTVFHGLRRYRSTLFTEKSPIMNFGNSRQTRKEIFNVYSSRIAMLNSWIDSWDSYSIPRTSFTGRT